MLKQNKIWWGKKELLLAKDVSFSKWLNRYNEFKICILGFKASSFLTLVFWYNIVDSIY